MTQQKLPHWLPSMVAVDGDWKVVLPNLYSVFIRDFKIGKPKYELMEVWWDRRIIPRSIYEEGFWHLIEREQCETEERSFDPRRAERLPWCSPTISNSVNVEIKVWRYKEKDRKVHTYLWLEHFDYLVILQEKEMRVGRVAYLVTAFHIDGDSKRRNLRVKYEKREK